MTLWDGLAEAFRLLLRGDPYLLDVLRRTALISGLATGVALAVGLPAGYALARGRWPGRTLLLATVHTGMGLPPIVVGLVIYLLLARSGPFGDLGWLYTPQAMVLAQVVIATPLVVSFTTASFQSLPQELDDLLRVLGAGPAARCWLLAREARLGLLAAVMAGFGAVVSEVGAALNVGGNLDGSTRVLTTAIVLEAARGEYARAIAFGAILLLLALAANLALTAAQQRER
ncbi:MAG: ABC transporter permease [Chloroflexota bacterium]|nr:ABC transporter permease [Dehalococcoidia bacterium]MDW8046440.1 ABC transporter permease [Chloroflexota bacterium]